MTEPTTIIAATCLLGLTIVVGALLRGWQEWLSLKRNEIERQVPKRPREIEGGAQLGAARIEIADLKERIKKLEAIASGVDL